MIGKFLDTWFYINILLMVLVFSLAISKIKIVEYVAPLFLFSTIFFILFILIVGTYKMYKNKISFKQL